MKITKHTALAAITGSFISFGNVAHAETAGLLKSFMGSDASSLIPLVIFVLAAVMVYLCNRPRVTVCARARRHNEESRG